MYRLCMCTTCCCFLQDLTKKLLLGVSDPKLYSLGGRKLREVYCAMYEPRFPYSIQGQTLGEYENKNNAKWRSAYKFKNKPFPVAQFLNFKMVADVVARQIAYQKSANRRDPLTLACEALEADMQRAANTSLSLAQFKKRLIRYREKGCLQSYGKSSLAHFRELEDTTLEHLRRKLPTITKEEVKELLPSIGMARSVCREIKLKGTPAPKDEELNKLDKWKKKQALDYIYESLNIN